MTTFAICTLGCKVNSYESQGYAQGLCDLGLTELSFKDIADIYIINTCAVTNTAAAKSRQKIHQAQRMNPHAMIVVVGCYAQSAYAKLQEDADIDLIIGSDQKEALPSLITEAYHQPRRKVMVHDMRQANAFEAIPVRSFTHQTRAYLKVQDGCNQFCSYCIIPYTRGKERSLAPDQVIEQARTLAAHRHLEIVLTGIHTGRYGREYHVSLCELLERLCHEVAGLERIRISSIEMNEISDELIALMKREKKLARHLHIPIQSADNEILARMNRPYRVEEYAQRIHRIRKEIANISISTDVITGFPGESEEHFQNGLKHLEALQFSFLHVFPFSKRDGTKAAEMVQQIDNATKKQRCTILNQISEQGYQAFKRSFVNQTVQVLWEESKDGMMFGHTSEYLDVYAPYDPSCLHKMETRRIIAYQEDKLICEAQEVSG